MSFAPPCTHTPSHQQLSNTRGLTEHIGHTSTENTTQIYTTQHQQYTQNISNTRFPHTTHTTHTTHTHTHTHTPTHTHTHTHTDTHTHTHTRTRTHTHTHLFRPLSRPTMCTHWITAAVPMALAVSPLSRAVGKTAGRQLGSGAVCKHTHTHTYSISNSLSLVLQIGHTCERHLANEL